MKVRILIIGSTGQLGIKLLKFCFLNSIDVDSITCNTNIKLLKKQSNDFNIKNIFCLSDKIDLNLFNEYIKKTTLNIIYFLDHGSESLNLLFNILKFQKKTYIAIANKEMLIAGNNILIDSIRNSKNYFIPLDSEHFSIINNKLSNDDIQNIFITASGGPFYKNKKINLNNVSQKRVLSHPKWKMGKNNLIDSSNFINKLLEIFELSIIYKINIEKINFLVSPEAFIHSIILYKNHIFTLNCFNNDMLITLSYPLSKFFDFKLNLKQKKFMNHNNYYFEEFNDKRFNIIKYFKILKKLDHQKQIDFMLLNNIAQKLYLSKKIQYNSIVKFIIKNLNFKGESFHLRSYSDILRYIKYRKLDYKKLLI